jgi:hypothetical protein
MEEIETRVLISKIRRRLSKMETNAGTEMEEVVDEEEILLIQVFSKLFVKGDGICLCCALVFISRLHRIVRIAQSV